MEQSDLLRMVAQTFDKLRVSYAVVGSTASTIYGEPRFTNDIDVVLDLQPDTIDAFCREFPSPEFYLSRSAVESAVTRRFQFNIIHPTSGLKVDCILAGDGFDQNQLRRSIAVPCEGGAYTVRFAAPEDVIIKKLEYFKLGQSEKHIRDICGMLDQQGDRIDRAYVRQWAQRKGLLNEWEATLTRLAAG